MARYIALGKSTYGEYKAGKLAVRAFLQTNAMDPKGFEVPAGQLARYVVIEIEAQQGLLHPRGFQRPCRH